MSLAGRWLVVTLVASCYGFVNAASAGTNVETATLNGQPFHTDLARIANLRLHLHDGDFRIVGSDSDEVTIHTDGKNRAQTKKMQVQLKRTGDSLDITFLHVPKNEVQVTIAVPKQTNLYARMRGGDLSVDGVTGDKDLELTGGDLQIQVPDPAEYGAVDLSVRFGDVSANQFGDPKGWLGNSLKRDGNGKYRLHAHVFAGDLTLKH
jgi:Putative adhesin